MGSDPDLNANGCIYPTMIVFAWSNLSILVGNKVQCLEFVEMKLDPHMFSIFYSLSTIVEYKIFN